jgi:type IV secretion system protein VirB2
MTTKTAALPNNMQRSKAVTVAFVALLSLLYLFPEFAHAANPFSGGAAAAKTDFLAIVAPIAGIALIAVGLLAWFGKISWFWLVGLVVGIVLVFGNDQVVTWIRGWFGV